MNSLDINWYIPYKQTYIYIKNGNKSLWLFEGLEQNKLIKAVKTYYHIEKMFTFLFLNYKNGEHINEMGLSKTTQS